MSSNNNHLRSLFLLSFFILFLLIINIKTFSRNSNGSGAFAQVPVGARATALGGAYVAIAKDPNVFYHNPAGIATLDWSYLSLNAQRIPLQRYNGTISFIHAPGENSTWAFGVGANLFNTQGIKSYDASGNQTGKVSNYSGVGYFTIAKLFGPKELFSIGVNTKFIHEKLDTATSYGGGIDLGARISVHLFGSEFIDIGVMGQDIFTMESFSNRDDPVYFDRIIKIGIATTFSDAWQISFQIDKNLSTSDKAIFRTGAYFKVWQAKGKIDWGTIKLKNFEETEDLEDLEKALEEPKKEFNDELYINLGYGDSNIGAGITLKIWGIGFDLAASIVELDWNKTTLLFSLNIPLY